VWQLLTLVGVAAAGGIYLGHLRRTPDPNGGTTLGLILGAVGTLLILLLVAFGVRKRSYRSRLGTLDGWLQAHIYLGLATVPVVLLHTGFRFQDLLAVACLVAMILVVLSGLVGTFFYTALPRKLTQVAAGTDPEETSERLQSLSRSMAQLADGRSSAFRGIYGKLEKEATPGRLAGWRLVLLGGGTRPGQVSDSQLDFGPLLGLVDTAERESLRKLLVLARQRRELHARLRYRQRYKNLLESWLWVHVPLTGLLLALLAVHIVAALWFRGLP
jgi:cytochrome b561